MSHKSRYSRRRRSRRRRSRRSRRSYRKLRGGESTYGRIKKYLQSPKGKRTAAIVGLGAAAAGLGYLGYRNRDKLKALYQKMTSK